MWPNARKLIGSLTRRERAAFMVSAGIFLGTAVFYGAVVFLNATASLPTEGGRWREGVVGQPVFINPVISGNDVDQDIAELVFAPLEVLSESIKADGLHRTWTIRLRDDIVWQDGERITSDDLIYTIDTITNPDSKSPLTASFEGVAVTRVSELETKIVLPSAYAFFGTTVGNLRIIPRHIFGNIPVQNFRLSSYVLEPIGSGPYRYLRYEKERDGFITTYELEANPSYALARPLIPRLDFVFARSGEELVNAFNRGDIDGFVAADPALLREATARKKIYRLTPERYYAVFINRSLAPSLKNLERRKALSNATKRDELVLAVWGGYAKAAEGLPPERIEESASTASLEGIELTLTYPNTPPLAETAKLLERQWSKVGVTLTLKAVRPAEVHEAIRTRNYELLLFGNTLQNPDDYYSFWHSTRKSPPGLNLSLYENSRVDKLLEEVRTETNDDRRGRLVASLRKLVTNDVPAIFLYVPDYLYIASPKLKGFEERNIVTASDRFAESATWYLKTARVFKGTAGEEEIAK